MYVTHKVPFGSSSDGPQRIIDPNGLVESTEDTRSFGMSPHHLRAIYTKNLDQSSDNFGHSYGIEMSDQSFGQCLRAISASLISSSPSLVEILSIVRSGPREVLGSRLCLKFCFFSPSFVRICLYTGDYTCRLVGAVVGRTDSRSGRGLYITKVGYLKLRNCRDVYHEGRQPKSHHGRDVCITKVRSENVRRSEV